MSAEPHPYVVSRVDRTPAGIRSMLPEGPDRREFDAAYRSALDVAKESFELTGLNRVLDEWQARALSLRSAAAAPGTLRRVAQWVGGDDVPTVSLDEVLRGRAL